MSNNIKKVIIAVLLLIIIGLVYYNYQNKQEFQTETQEMKQEKDNLLSDLSDLEKQYNEAISKNTELSDELIKQKESVNTFRDSLKKIKNTNWKLIKYYKKKVLDLNSVSYDLIKLNDSLITANTILGEKNKDLSLERDNLSSTLKTQVDYNDEIVKKNTDLSHKVILGKEIKANNFKVSTYKVKSNGSSKETDRSRRTNLFIVSFELIENSIADEQEVKAYISIKMPNGKILNDKGVFADSNGVDIHFTDKTFVPYKNKTIANEVRIKFGDVKLEKGTYIIDFYINKEKVGTAKKVLR